jgi:predicted MFS family arabinose efflux permease
LIGAVTTGWVQHIRRQGWAVIIAVTVWGAAIAVFGLVDTLWIALVMLAVAGWADVISAVLRNTLLQTSIPERFRSRMSSIQMAVVQGGPRLGDMESGLVATVTSVEFAVVSGGLACIAGAALIGALMPGFRHHVAGEVDDVPV